MAVHDLRRKGPHFKDPIPDDQNGIWLGVVNNDDENKGVDPVNIIQLKGVARKLEQAIVLAPSTPRSNQTLPQEPTRVLTSKWPSSTETQIPQAPKASQTGYAVLARLKKDLALLSVCDALQMQQELSDRGTL